MEPAKTYDNYPIWIVILSNSFSLIIYTLGIIILYRTGWIVSFLYLIFILTLEYRLISTHCINCYYWGKTCGFGKGRLSSLVFKSGDVSKFCNNEISWKEMIPDLLISLIPVGTAIVLLIIEFDFFLLLVAVLLITLTTIGNGFIRGKLTCRFCKQRESGCPAQKLFNKDK
jgi:hypothetical protein